MIVWAHIVDRLIKLMRDRKIDIKKSKILIMGITFKENCPDLRNSKVVDIINELRSKNAEVDIYDPWVDIEEVKESCGLMPIDSLNANSYDAVLLTVAHDLYKNMKPRRN